MGSTVYFACYGDEAGGRLQQQHFDLLTDAMIGTQGQLFHTAGDGALLGFPTVETAADTMVLFHQSSYQLTCRLASEQQWKRTLQFLSALSPQSPTEMTTVSNTTPHPRWAIEGYVDFVSMEPLARDSGVNR